MSETLSGTRSRVLVAKIEMLTLYKVLLQEGKVECPEPLESKLMTQKFVNLQNTFCWPYELKREGQCVFSSQVCNV